MGVLERLHCLCDSRYNHTMEKYEKKNLAFARSNRKARNATKQESVLWHLFLKICSVNFSRQYRIGEYIVDFYAPSIKVVIELDGGQHYEEKALAYDEARTAFLSSLGITVLRFTNDDVDKRLNGVVTEIKRVIAEKQMQ